MTLFYQYPGSYMNMIALVLLSCLAVISAFTTSSDGSLEETFSTGKKLLQTRKSCPIDFENQNYTIITSQCKGPNYPVDQCCSALKQFACPYYKELNDLTTDCASTMFSYITLSANYPPGLFANECREGKEGLDCSAYPPEPSSNSSGSSITRRASGTLILAGAFVWLLLRYL